MAAKEPYWPGEMRQVRQRPLQGNHMNSISLGGCLDRVPRTAQRWGVGPGSRSAMSSTVAW